MSTKLTLRLDDKLINNAKKAARSRGVKKEIQESPVLAEISGILPPRTDVKKLVKSYKRHLEERYR